MQQLVSHIWSSDVLKNYFSPHSFVTVSKSQGGYEIHDASHHIAQALNELNEASGKQLNSKSMKIDNILLDKLTAQAQASEVEDEFGFEEFGCGFVAEDVECY